MWDLIVSVPDHCLSFLLFMIKRAFTDIKLHLIGNISVLLELDLHDIVSTRQNISVCVPLDLSMHCLEGFVCLFVLRLNVPVNNFSVMSGRSHRFLGN